MSCSNFLPKYGSLDQMFFLQFYQIPHKICHLWPLGGREILKSRPFQHILEVSSSCQMPGLEKETCCRLRHFFACGMNDRNQVLHAHSINHSKPSLANYVHKSVRLEYSNFSRETDDFMAHHFSARPHPRQASG